MKMNLYDGSRRVYGSEVRNMQPVAFGYVPANRCGEASEETEKSAPCIGKNCGNRSNMLFTRHAVQNG